MEKFCKLLIEREIKINFNEFVILQLDKYLDKNDILQIIKCNSKLYGKSKNTDTYRFYRAG